MRRSDIPMPHTVRVTRWLQTGTIIVAIAGVSAVPQSTRSSPIVGGPIVIDAVPVVLNPQNPSATAIGDFVYAGGLSLTSRDTNQLHGLSDLDVTGTDRLTAVSDFGNVLDVRVVLDKDEQLVGVADARLALLTGENGQPLAGKGNADAEGLALLTGGDRLVSFERRHRIGLYPATGGPPRAVPAPKVNFPGNGGMEALAADPEAAADAYVVGAETGETWTCRLSSVDCIRGPSVEKPKDFSLTALKRLPGMRTVYLLRASDGKRGRRASLQIVHDASIVARLDIAPPMTVDNFEGIAAVPRAAGGIRFYLLSDDNASASQRTLLLAFDYRPH